MYTAGPHFTSTSTVAVKMSKDKKKKQFTPGGASNKLLQKELPDSHYADEEGIATTNIILAPSGETDTEGLDTTKDGTDEYLFKGINPGSKTGNIELLIVS